MKNNTLSKTRFKLALECPTKVFYSLDRRYVNRKQDDEFLEALAEGGHQVGALAKLMFLARDPQAVEITAQEQEEQISETARLMERADVTIFEATFRHEHLLVRVDVLQKRGRQLDLIEVKAKSWDPSDDSLIGKTARANPITPAWEPYVYDVAFQERVVSRAHPEYEVRPWLMLLDKSRTNSVAGLGLKFPITGTGRSKSAAAAAGFDVRELKEALLIQVDAQEAVRRAQTQVRTKKGGREIEFDSLIAETSGAIQRGERLGPFVGPPCKSCEFYCPPADRAPDALSGWAECMEINFRAPVTWRREESIFGFYGQADVQAFLQSRRLWIKDLEEAELQTKPVAGKISRTVRHEMQWREMRFADKEPFLEKEALEAAIGAWRFPLHFIDFETAQPALPFHVGHRPYQPILFQFSHHVVGASGSIQHASEYLLTEGEGSPSIEVLRRLRDSVGNDDGTILHWYPHERSILGKIDAEIQSAQPRDATELCGFLAALGLEKDSQGRLFDLGRLVADQVFLPGTGGSSSMKKFLPAVLRSSDYVRTRYAKPVYGSAELRSHNFTAQTWVVERDGVVLDPYKLLSPLFGEQELDEAITELAASEGDVIANGAAAMIAYARLQDPGLPHASKEELRRQLLRYCELDTLAMVMVYEALMHWCGVRG